MSKEAKMLIVSMILMVAGIALLYFTQNYSCTTIEYQNLSGTHSITECSKNKPKTCWDNYATEELAIQQCEGTD
jgi:hypothetical protein